MADIAQIGIEVDTSGLQRANREIDKLGKAGQSVGQPLGRVSSAFDKMGRGVQRTTGAIFSLQGALAGLGAGLALRKVVGDFSQFERLLIQVGKTADIQGEELDQLGRSIQEIGTRVPLPTARLLELASAAGQVGVSGSADIAKFAETLGKLETATDVAGEEGARALARLLNLTGESASNVDRLGSALTALGNNLAATEQEIVQTATFLGSATSAYEVNTQAVVGLSGALRALGQRAETSGSSIGAAFAEIDSALAEGGENLETLQRLTGQTAAELQDAFGQNAERVLVDFADGLGQLTSAAQSKVLEDFNLAGRETRRVIQAMSGNIETVRKALSMANDEWGTATALNLEAARTAESFSAQMTFLGNAVNRAAVEIGRELAPVIVQIANDLADFLNEASETGSLEDTFEGVAGAAKVLADNLDAVVVVAGALVGARVGSMFGPLGALIGTAAGALVSYRAQLDVTNPAAEQLRRVQEELNRVLGDMPNASDEAKRSAYELAEAQIAQTRAALEAFRANALVRGALESYGEGGTSADDVIREVEQEIATLTEQMEALKKPAEDANDTLGGTAKAAHDSAVAVDRATESIVRQKDEAQELIRDLQIENSQRRQLLAAYEIGADAVADTTNAIELENALRAVSVDLTDKQRAALAEEARERIALVAQIEEQSAKALELERSREAAKDTLKGMQNENKALQLAIEGREQEAEWLRESAQLKERLGSLYDENAEAIRREWEQSQKLNEELERQRATIRKLEEVSDRAFDQMGDAIADMVTSGETSFDNLRNVAMSVLNDIASEMFKLAAINPLKDALLGTSSPGLGGLLGDIGGVIGGSLFGGGGGGDFGGYDPTVMHAAKGAAFDSGSVIPFANGGIVNRPTLFPMANGAGLMGEAGPEAIMPLKRGPGGRLGVESGGSAPVVNVNVINEGNNEVETRQEGNNIDVIIKRTVAQDIRDGGEVFRSMRGAFGLQPSRIGRS